jgi:hypothetical protein
MGSHKICDAWLRVEAMADFKAQWLTDTAPQHFNTVL